MRPRFALVLFLALALCAVAHSASARIFNTDIYCLQDTLGGAPYGGTYGCSAARVGDTVYVGLLHPVVVVGMDTKPTSYGFYIQDQRAVNSGTAAFSGITVFTGSVNMASAIGMTIGDIVVVKGKITEFGAASTSQTEIDRFSSSVIESVEVVGHTSTLPPAIQLSTADLGPVDTPTAEKWEGVLIKVGPVIQNSNTLSFNEFSVYDSTATPVDTMHVDDKFMAPDPVWPPAGTHYSSITGVFMQEFDQYHLWPRGFSDIVTNYAFPQVVTAAYPTDVDKVRVQFEQKADSTAQTPTHYVMGNLESIASAVLAPDSLSVTLTTSPAMANGVANSVTVSNVRTYKNANMTGPATFSFLGGITPFSLVQQRKSAANDSSIIAGKRCTVRGICIGSNSPDDFVGTAYIANSAGGAKSGVAIFGSPTVMSLGDDVTVSGFVSEFNRKTELAGIQYANVNSTGNADPPASVITPSQLAARDSANTPLFKSGGTAADTTAENWEGVLVKVNTSTVGGDSLGFGQWFLIQGPDSTLCDDESVVTFDYDPHDGDTMAAQGVVDWAFNAYRIMPRVNGDITNFVTAVGGGGPSTLSLRGANPVVGRARIDFTLPAADRVRLDVFDLQGRLVATLADGVPYGAGPHTIAWSGRTNHGASVPAGVYVYRLWTNSGTVNRRIVLAH